MRLVFLNVTDNEAAFRRHSRYSISNQKSAAFQLQMVRDTDVVIPYSLKGEGSIIGLGIVTRIMPNHLISYTQEYPKLTYIPNTVLEIDIIVPKIKSSDWAAFESSAGFDTLFVSSISTGAHPSIKSALKESPVTIAETTHNPILISCLNALIRGEPNEHAVKTGSDQ